jgi:hypothetical protein
VYARALFRRVCVCVALWLKEKKHLSLSHIKLLADAMKSAAEPTQSLLRRQQWRLVRNFDATKALAKLQMEQRQ